MGNGRETSKRYNFMDKKECLHYLQWIDLNIEESMYTVFSSVQEGMIITSERNDKITIRYDGKN